MGRKPVRKELRSVIKRLDNDERNRLLKIAKQLADSGTSKSAESLNEDSNLPSYTAAVDDDAYTRKKQETTAWGR
jgi:hypothetical protein